MSQHGCAVVVELLPADEGGGVLALLADLPGCMSDGASPDEAVATMHDTLGSRIAAAHEFGQGRHASSRHLVLETAP